MINNLENLLIRLTQLSKEIIFEYFPNIKLNIDDSADQIIFSNGLSYIYIEYINNIFHISIFDQINQEQVFCYEENDINILNEESIELSFKKGAIKYFEEINVGLLRFNYKNINKRLREFVESVGGEYEESIYYDFYLEIFDINITINKNKYNIRLEGKDHIKVMYYISSDFLKGFTLDINKKEDSIAPINNFIDDIIHYLKVR